MGIKSNQNLGIPVDDEVPNMLYGPEHTGNRICFMYSWKYWKSHLLKILEIRLLTFPGTVFFGTVFLGSWTTFQNDNNFSIFKIWLRRPTQSAQQTQIEILCRIVGSMSRYLWSDIIFYGKTWTYSSLAWMSTWISRWRRRRCRRPNNSPHLVRSLDHHAQGANIPFGNPSLR